MNNSEYSNIDQYGHKLSWKECGRRQTALREKLQSSLFTNIDDSWHEAAIKRNFSILDEVKAIHPILTPDNYAQTLRTLLKMVEAHDQIVRRRSDMFQQNISTGNRIDYNGNLAYYFAIPVRGLSETRQNLIVGDLVIMSDRSNPYKVTKITGLCDGLVLVSNEILLEDETFFSSPLDVFFVSCGSTRDNCEKALDRLERDPILRSRLFEAESRFCHQDKLELEPPSCESRIVCDIGDAEERFQQLNLQQQQAVLSIIGATSWPKPYILFGPPGTGKTHTLAEAIAQIYAREPLHKILYCANSNSCVDHMVDKLRKIGCIAPRDIARLSAGDKTDGIGKSRIILTTNIKSACIMDELDFHYVIVDEAGSASELETIIPICCLKLSGCLVLAGDPKLLGPIVQCDQARSYGLGKSMLERIFDLKMYQRDKATGAYDSRFITKLILNYRCDPDILAISNKLFYDNELKFAFETPRSFLRMMRVDKPVQFRFVRGQDERPLFSKSRINHIEANQCVNLILQLYEMNVRPDQIGVITPYRLQVELIQDKFKKRLNSSPNLVRSLESRFMKGENSDDYYSTKATQPENKKLKLGEFNELTQSSQGDVSKGRSNLFRETDRRPSRWLCQVDTVDAYRGSKRDIIIISTVRTDRSGTLDFINNPRRFNVAISRAKWLVFVIGHEDFLQDQSNWRELIELAGKDVSSCQIQSSIDSGYSSEQFSQPFR